MKKVILLSLLCLSSSAALQGVGRTIAVGDVHGDFRSFVMILRDAGLIDESKTWIGGKTHLVQTGDILDRGTESVMVIELLMSLENQAPGQVHFLLGNHESMVIAGDLRYVHPDDAEPLGGMKRFIRAMRVTGQYGKWFSQHGVALRINQVLFVHGGISSSFSSCNPRQLNDAMRKALTSNEDLSQIRGSDGPLWYRGWAVDRSSVTERALSEALYSSSSTTAVIGHTVRTQGIGTRFKGRVVMIDTGLSSLYGGPMQYLEITQNGHKTVTVQRGSN